MNAAGYLRMIHQMKELITAAGKKAYTLAMGRPNPAKLANFPEVKFNQDEQYDYELLPDFSTACKSFHLNISTSVMFSSMSLVHKLLFWIAKSF